ncbi:MAG: D-alanyl-D-alanine carboxypeptidase/D-alanyl-D-alanine-endopeptidase [Bacteroidota bacterium]|nr:D-alanyl-D-alanine carboxypeptidase/D-alanyl-D-alanine-endopeptidase [Bacteroidota bacterium]
MKKLFIVAGCLLLVACSLAQDITKKLQQAYRQFEADSQLKHAISSLYVIDARTSKVVFDKNSQVGLAPASTQKIITAATSFELLGRGYRYKTEFGFYPNDIPVGPITIRSFGDPSFGSSRYNSTNPEKLLSAIVQKAKDYGRPYSGMFQIDNTSFETQVIPDGWIFQDIGNYYGAGAGGFNWRENQFDLYLKSAGKTGDSVQVLSVAANKKFSTFFINELRSASKGTGDNAYIYLPVGNNEYIVRGTIPVDENNFKISGAVYDAPGYFSFQAGNGFTLRKIKDPVKVFYTYYSPGMDSLIYWFLKKSINLYGEALIKTFAYEEKGFGSTDSGVAIVKDFWKQKGLDEGELNISDGSGLSPQNRVTTHAQVEILKYARTKDWFPYFFDALPEYNGMKMKSGSIRDVKAFCGYQKGRDGNEYIFSFLVNNYNGSSSGVVNKMYKVLDVLKE